MAILQGSVAKVRNTVSVNSSGGENSQTSTTHISVFQINGQPVQTSAGNPIMIDEGDNVKLAGQIQNGVFKALAYRNLTIGVSDHDGWALNTGVGLLFALIGVGCAISSLRGDWGPLLLGIPFFLIGTYTAHKGFNVFSAIQELEAAQ